MGHFPSILGYPKGESCDSPCFMNAPASLRWPPPNILPAFVSILFRQQRCYYFLSDCLRIDSPLLSYWPIIEYEEIHPNMPITFSPRLLYYRSMYYLKMTNGCTFPKENVHPQYFSVDLNLEPTGLANQYKDYEANDKAEQTDGESGLHHILLIYKSCRISNSIRRRRDRQRHCR